MIPAHMSDLYTWRALSFTEEHGRPVHAAMLALEYEGSAEALVESGVYAANPTASIIMASNSTGVSFPSRRWRRLR